MKPPRNPFAKQLIAGAVAAIFCAVPGRFHAQEPEKTAEEATLQGCVWKLSDGDNTVYLAGSVHLLRETDYPLPAVYDMAYADSSSVIFEIDMGTLTGISAAMEMRRLGSYPADDSLKNHLSEKSFDRVVEFFASRKENLTARQMSAPVVDRFKPGMVFLMISSVQIQEMGGRPELGLESQYYKRAERDDKPSSGLETIAYQLSRFDELTTEEIETLINETLDDVDKMPTILDGIIGAWRLGDEAELDELLNEEMEEGARLRELLLTERNENWIPRIEKALEGTENVLILVGAAHLIGKNSVIDLLRKKGYRIERVFSVPEELKKAA